MSDIMSAEQSRRSIWIVVISVIVVLVLMQFARFVIPELELDNPPVKRTVAWDSSQTEQLWKDACADCHSNETVYPAYSYIAPIGWLVARDTHEGRREFNISEDSVNVSRLVDVIEEGEMPPAIYKILHSDADLSDADKQTLINGLQATFGDTNRQQPADNRSDENDGESSENETEDNDD